MNKQKIINLAVIAHVDAGKSTLVDAFLNQSGVFSQHEQPVDQVMDSNDLERERGITIYSKNCSVQYHDIKINIVDTPGHADFSSEVERIIKTVDTVILLVDSAEGPMPQTRFVLKKALEQGLNPILFINKIDKADRRVEEVIDLVYELFIDLEANDSQLDFPILYGVAKEGIAQINLDDDSQNLEPLFKTIIDHVPPYSDLSEEPLQLQISSLAYDDYVGRLGIGRLFKGVIKPQMNVHVVDYHGNIYPHKINQVYTYIGMKRVSVDAAYAGDIVQISGISAISIGDTVGLPNQVEVLDPLVIEEPTLSMNFMVNTSPFAGKSGKYVTSRSISERLQKELEVNVGLKVEETSTTDTFKVSGRGELHLTILIENMRREGYELAISKPQVIYKTIENKQYEPIEEVMIEIPTNYSGTIISKLNLRRGELLEMDEKNSMTTMKWHVPTRGLLGYRQEFINDTHGEGTMVRVFFDYEPFKGSIEERESGSMISTEQGTAMTYAIFNLQERGSFFIGAQTEVYEGMIVGQSSRNLDMEINPTKNKKATAIRSDGRDEAMKLVPHRVLTLENAIEFIKDDELVEVTPDAIRLRKKHLKSYERKQANRHHD
ncbi:MAG: translational GTPase TypA [Erysipelothrix sp.]|nr:translational GTPase TypA [Erysipelothrix sp.]